MLLFPPSGGGSVNPWLNSHPDFPHVSVGLNPFSLRLKRGRNPIKSAVDLTKTVESRAAVSGVF